MMATSVSVLSRSERLQSADLFTSEAVLDHFLSRFEASSRCLQVDRVDCVTTTDFSEAAGKAIQRTKSPALKESRACMWR